MFVNQCFIAPYLPTLRLQENDSRPHLTHLVGSAEITAPFPVQLSPWVLDLQVFHSLQIQILRRIEAAFA